MENIPDKTNHTKVLFEIQCENGTTEIESLWTIPVETGYKIDNIPFYVFGIAEGDIVSAECATDGALYYKKLISASGHSTVRLWFSNKEDVLQTRNALKEMGCSSELDLSRLLAVDIPPTIPYEVIRTYLDQQEKAGVFEYEEACLGQS